MIDPKRARASSRPLVGSRGCPSTTSTFRSATWTRAAPSTPLLWPRLATGSCTTRNPHSASAGATAVTTTSRSHFGEVTRRTSPAISRSPRRARLRSTHSTPRRWQREDGTTADQGNAHTAIPTMPPSSSTRRSQHRGRLPRPGRCGRRQRDLSGLARPRREPERPFIRRPIVHRLAVRDDDELERQVEQRTKRRNSSFFVPRRRPDA